MTELASLDSRTGRLRAEIKQLEVEREPLLVDTYSRELYCTGSMEPKLTCMDTITLLRNYNAADITIGTVISFNPDPECYDDLGSILHRVVDIKTDVGQLYFQTKGDNNDDVDECWVPAEDVLGYVVAVQKDIRPENREMRTHVNQAKAKRREAREAMDAALEEYDTTYDRFCKGVGTCRLWPNRISKLHVLYDEYRRLFDVYKMEWTKYRCTLATVKSYRKYGVYIPCIFPAD